jgi:hypothetical protein
MDTNGIEWRIARLETLAVGLAEGVALWRGAVEVPLLPMERKAYLPKQAPVWERFAVQAKSSARAASVMATTAGCLSFLSTEMA